MQQQIFLALYSTVCAVNACAAHFARVSTLCSTAALIHHRIPQLNMLVRECKQCEDPRAANEQPGVQDIGSLLRGMKGRARRAQTAQTAQTQHSTDKAHTGGMISDPQARASP